MLIKYTALGNLELIVSRICMGFGDAGKEQCSWTFDETNSRDIIKMPEIRR